MLTFAKLTFAACLIAALNASELAHAQSATVCDAFARDYAKHASRQGQVVKRGTVGAVVGTGIGVIFGGAAVGAVVGGGLGAIGGGKKRRQAEQRIYNAAYTDCMHGNIQ